jgi:hypothetical protein
LWLLLQLPLKNHGYLLLFNILAPAAATVMMVVNVVDERAVDSGLIDQVFCRVERGGDGQVEVLLPPVKRLLLAVHCVSCFKLDLFT